MFVKACMVLQSLPSQNKWDDAVQQTYLLGLSDWSDNVVGTVVMHVLNNSEFRPTVAEMRKMAIKLFDPMLSADTIYEQIRQVLVMVPLAERKSYVARMVAAGKMRDEVRRVVEECGGWQRLSNMETNAIQGKVQSAVSVVYETTDFDHVFVTPPNSPALERGRKAMEAIE